MLKINRKLLAEALDRVLGVSERQPIVAIQDSVLFSVDKDGTLLLTATDGQMHITSSLVVEGNKGNKGGNGLACCVKTFKLSAVLKNMIAANINLAVTDKGMQISSSDSSGDKDGFNLETRAAEDFPRAGAESDDIVTIELSQDKLLQGIRRLSPIISQQQHRQYQTGLYFDFVDGGVNLVATDNHRLGLDLIALKKSLSEVSFIVPRKAILQLQGLLDESDNAKQVKVTVSRMNDAFRTARFTLPNTDLSVQLIPTTFPNYQRVFPDSNENEVIFDLASLRTCLDQVCAVHDKKGEAVRLDLKKDQVTISAIGSQSRDAAQFNLSVPYHGEPIEISFNSSYLKDLINAFEKFPKIQLCLKDAGASMLCLPAKSDSPVRYVLMPVRNSG